MSDRFSTLFIGCGRMAGLDSAGNRETHALTVGMNEKFESSACVDTNQTSLSRFSKTYGCNPFDSISEACNSNVFDLAVIASPSEYHFDHIEQLFGQKTLPRVVFVEKPLAVTSQQSQQLSAKFRGCGSYLFVNHTRRFDDRFLWLRDQIRKKRWGKLHRVGATYYGGWINNGTHIVDTIRMLTGEEVKLSKVIGEKPGKNPIDPSLEFEGSLADQVSQVWITAIPSSIYQIFEFDFWFQNGRLSIKNFGQDIQYETCVENEDGESVLNPVELDELPLPGLPLALAYKEIANYLEYGKAGKVLESASLSQAQRTLKTIFEGVQLRQEMLRKLD